MSVAQATTDSTRRLDHQCLFVPRSLAFDLTVSTCVFSAAPSAAETGVLTERNDEGIGGAVSLCLIRLLSFLILVPGPFGVIPVIVSLPAVAVLVIVNLDRGLSLTADEFSNPRCSAL